MFKVTSVKKWSILLVALLVCATVVLAACNTTKPFEPVDEPTGEGIDSNGGIAVRYGDYIYYVNGYQSNVSAENTYVDVKDAPRVGSVVRIKIDEIEKILAINDDKHLSSSQKTKNIAAAVRGGEIDEETYAGAETVIPNIYYSANTATTALNGIYIFNDRIYITTPNDKLTAGGNTRTNESVLTSFKLDGSAPVRHFEFATNSAQIWLYEGDDGRVYATYAENSKLYFLDVAAGESTLVTKKGATDEATDEDETEKTVSSINFDLSDDGKCVFFIDGDGSLCKLEQGEKEYEVIIENEINEDHGHADTTYTIKSVNNGYVYYTVSDEHNDVPQHRDLQLYYASSAEDVDGTNVAMVSANLYEAYGWKADKLVVVTENTKGQGYKALYWYEGGELIEATPILSYEYNSSPLSNIKVEGDTLYYTASSVTYTIDLSDVSTEGAAGTPYAYGMATSAVGWSMPDVLNMGEYSYVFTLASGSVSIVKFDPAKKANVHTSATTLTLTAAPDED